MPCTVTREVHIALPRAPPISNPGIFPLIAF